MINSRIKVVRESLGMSQETFASELGLKRNSISLIENGKRNPSERTLNDISKKFDININWLKDGLGEKDLEPSSFSLDEYAKQNNLSALEFDIMKGYMELDKDLRKSLMSHFKSIFNKHPDIETEDKTSSPTEKSVEQLEEEYKKMYSKSVSEQDVSVSSGIEGDINKVV